MDISLSDIIKSYDDSGDRRMIFDGMTAVFPAGEFSVIMGKSGVGKSSLLNLISGIDLPDNGSIRIGPHRVSEMNDTQRTVFRRQHIGFVYQSFNLIPVLTVLENVTLVAELDGVRPGVAREKALSLLDRVGLSDRCHDHPDNLSGGEQQRVAIVRALVNDPTILLADEPTGNLDQETGGTVLKLLTDLAKNSGKTLIMVTHSPEAIAYADQVYLVADHTLKVRPKRPLGP
ncbi:MAG: ABC transporter ATP-binding protein [Pseudomonadota bacterium]